MSMRRDQNRLPAAANRNRQRRGWPGPSLAKNVWRSYGLVLLVAMSALIPFAGTAQDRTSTMEVRGREFLSRTPGGTAFQSTCARSVRATDAGTVFAEDATDAEIGGYCACMAAYLFSDKASLFHGRLSQVTQRAVAGSLMAGALQDAKVVGGENRAAMALGFYMEAQKDCFATHLDKQARKAAATRKATDELVKAQELPDRYGMEIEKAVAQNDGGTLLVCRSDESHWPNTPETLFVLDPMQSQGDYYDGLFTDAGFAEFIGEIGTRDTAEITHKSVN